MEPEATADEIKKAYKKKALRWHPDRCKPEDKLVAEEKFKEVSAAYETLCDPDRKVPSLPLTCIVIWKDWTEACTQIISHGINRN